MQKFKFFIKPLLNCKQLLLQFQRKPKIQLQQTKILQFLMEMRLCGKQKEEQNQFLINALILNQLQRITLQIIFNLNKLIFKQILQDSLRISKVCFKTNLMTQLCKYFQRNTTKYNQKILVRIDQYHMKIFNLFMAQNLDLINFVQILHNFYLNMKFNVELEQFLGNLISAISIEYKITILQNQLANVISLVIFSSQPQKIQFCKMQTTQQINDLILKLIPHLIINCSLSFIFIAIYIVYTYKDYKEDCERSDTEQRNLSPQNILQNRNFIYQGNSKVFKERFKQIHQTISLFNYKDKSIEHSYRILEVLSQLNLFLTLTILEFQMLNNQILFIFLFIIINPLIIFIMRFFTRQLSYIQIQKDCCFHKPASSYYILDDTLYNYVQQKCNQNNIKLKQSLEAIQQYPKYFQNLQLFWKNNHLQINSHKFEKHGSQSTISFQAFFCNAQQFRRNI
ncbi:unnamed protein product [Paramecium pentaurelia]|uniref:Transmembrane protein n=1 Tax=Paramecium pentaurelia TaxID=43138 RepID=A0A8S1WTR2_9CILI|nr:unnamed protein product [Paramecium pentaurelia]